MQRLSVRPVAGRAWAATRRASAFEAAQLGDDGGAGASAAGPCGRATGRGCGRAMGELGVEAQRRLEELGRRLAGAELVQAEAGVVEEHRLARLLGEAVERLAGDRQVEAGELARRRRRGGRRGAPRSRRGGPGREPRAGRPAIRRRQGDDGGRDGGAAASESVSSSRIAMPGSSTAPNNHAGIGRSSGY